MKPEIYVLSETLLIKKKITFENMKKNVYICITESFCYTAEISTR